MPFVQRVVEPRALSRGLQEVVDLEDVTNGTLSNALRQLASLMIIAQDIFVELNKDLGDVQARSKNLKERIGKVDGRLKKCDPKTVPVPEGDISTFALLKEHYCRPQDLTTGLFSSDSRPSPLQALYAAAARTPVHAMRQLDAWRRDGRRSSRFFLCTPVLEAKRRKIRSKVDIDIETRMPAAVGELRRWTSSEAIGDVTVATDCVNRITSNTTVEDDVTDLGATSGDEAIDHKLPSPEEQLQVLALKFPAEVVPVDISGRRFDRMSVQRRSLLHTETVCEEDGSGTVKRRTRTRKPRGKRRNTLAGTDQKEIRDALTAGEEPPTILETESPEVPPVIRSRSTDILRSKKPSPSDKKSHFNTLKQWGKSRLKLINKSLESKTEKVDDIDDVNIYETITARRRKTDKLTHEKKPSYSSSEKSSNLSLPIATAVSFAVKLRESSAVRKRRKDEHSSSGNWSASSESGRASIGSEITTHPKSTTSTATSNNSLGGPPSSVHSRRRFPPSASSSVTSEGTLTPDIIHDIQDDGETSSVYSCDTEGYYTSFHMDSGLKTLKEEEVPSIALHSTTAFSSENCTILTAENEYELFGKGSTSTTTSSAGTVCTTLRASESARSLVVGPAVPERKSSLNSSTNSSLDREKTSTIKRSPASTKATVVAVVHKQNSGDISPDSGHNTSSSPIESVSSPNGPPSSSEFEFSESSDLEGVERIERIRIKTTINSSRIPSMCVITPPHSDDESVKEENEKRNNLNIPDLGSKNATRPKLNLPLNNETEIKRMQLINVNPNSGYATIETLEKTEPIQKSTRAPSPSGGTVTITEPETKSPSQPIIKATLLPLNNMLGKLKTNITNFASRKEKQETPETVFDSGDYVTIADVRNNNEKAPITEILYANDIVKKSVRETEYVSLNELPIKTDNSASNSLERRRQGARVTLDAEGKVVYSSDSLKRGKHTTFEPGPFVKDVTPTNSPLPNRTPRVVRPVNSEKTNNKVVIRANTKSPECVRMPSTIVRPVRVSRERSLSPAHDTERALSPSRNQMHPQTADRYYFRDSPLEYQQRDDFLMQRNSPMYRTLPSRINTMQQPTQQFTYQTDYYDKFNSLPRRQFSQPPTYQVPSPLEYNFFSPIPKNKELQTAHNESLRISPIDPRNTGGFQSSTPSKPQNAINLSNKLLSPKKSTMSNEELYAMIHKSKKKLNIKTEDVDSTAASNSGRNTPVKQPETGYIARSRNSWSPISDNALNDPGNRQSWGCDRIGPKQTSRLDFKKLLLQQKSNVVPTSTKLSAVEQLKLSKNQAPIKQPSMNILDLSSSPRSLTRKNSTPGSPEKQRPPSKLLSPRSNWRFANPRSDVLSSTILEDCREDESSHSSLEKSKSPKVQTGNGRTQRMREDEKSKSTNGRSQRMQAQRAEFFKTPINKSPTSTYSFFKDRQSPSPPTLETAL